jgi:hypothetical protein
VLESAAQLRQQLAARGGDLQAPGQAAKQLHVQMGFQAFDLMADGRRGDV